MSPRLESLLAAADQCAASDLLLHEGRPALLRVSQEWREVDGGNLETEVVADVWNEVGAAPDALEYFSNQGLVSKLLLEARAEELTDLIEQGDGREAISFNRSLKQLVSSGQISSEVALSHSPAPEELQRLLQGISSGSR